MAIKKTGCKANGKGADGKKNTQTCDRGDVEWVGVDVGGDVNV
jgi:hypothetical protein